MTIHKHLINMWRLGCQRKTPVQCRQLKADLKLRNAECVWNGNENRLASAFPQHMRRGSGEFKRQNPFKQLFHASGVTQTSWEVGPRDGQLSEACRQLEAIRTMKFTAESHIIREHIFYLKGNHISKERLQQNRPILRPVGMAHPPYSWWGRRRRQRGGHGSVKGPPSGRANNPSLSSHLFSQFLTGDCGLGVLNSPWPTETQAECIWNASLYLGNALWLRLEGLLWWLSGTESACNARDTGDEGLIPGSGRYPDGGNGNPLQYSCLGKPRDRGAWWATVHRVTKSRTWLSTHTHPWD